MKEFTTAVANRPSKDTGEDAVTHPVTVKIDDREVTFRGATSSELFMLMAAISDTGTLSESIATSINVLYQLMEEDDRRWLKRRLFDPTDPMGPDDIAEYIGYLIEEWSARPTESPGDSSSSPSRTGQNSTARRSSKAKTS